MLGKVIYLETFNPDELKNSSHAHGHACTILDICLCGNNETKSLFNPALIDFLDKLKQ